jgi:hypothetical protein
MPILMHQVRILTNQVSSVVLRPKKVEIQKIVCLSYTCCNEHQCLCILEIYLTHVFLANCLGQKFEAVASVTFIQKYQGQTSEFLYS